MLIYKIDVLNTLKEKGYNTSRLRNEKIIGEGTIQSIRKKKMITMKSLDKICDLLNMQPGELIEWKSEKSKDC